jgi:hypothetical protein
VPGCSRCQYQSLATLQQASPYQIFNCSLEPITLSEAGVLPQHLTRQLQFGQLMRQLIENQAQDLSLGLRVFISGRLPIPHRIFLHRKHVLSVPRRPAASNSAGGIY